MGRYSSAGEIINQAAMELGLGRQADPFQSTDPVFQQLVALLTTCGKDLCRRHAWPQLIREYVIATDIGVIEYELPDDFLEMVDQSGWNRTTRFPLGGPLSPQEWQYLKAAVVGVTFTVLFRIGGTGSGYPGFGQGGNSIVLFPTPAAAHTIAFEYRSRNWVAPVAQSTKSYSPGPVTHIGSGTVVLSPDWQPSNQFSVLLRVINTLVPHSLDGASGFNVATWCPAQHVVTVNVHASGSGYTWQLTAIDETPISSDVVSFTPGETINIGQTFPSLAGLTIQTMDVWDVSGEAVDDTYTITTPDGVPALAYTIQAPGGLTYNGFGDSFPNVGSSGDIVIEVPDGNGELLVYYDQGTWVVGDSYSFPMIFENQSYSYSEVPSASSDALLFDDLLLVRALKLAWRKAKGFDTTVADSEFKDTLDLCLDQMACAPRLSLVGTSIQGRLLDHMNLPVTGFGR